MWNTSTTLSQCSGTTTFGLRDAQLDPARLRGVLGEISQHMTRRFLALLGSHI